MFLLRKNKKNFCQKTRP